MRPRRPQGRKLKRLAVCLLVLILCYPCAAIVGALVPSAHIADDGRPEHQVLLIAGPIHYDFILPLDDATRTAFADLPDAALLMDLDGAQNLLVGWGAHDFYTTVGAYGDVTAQAAWRGLTGDSSVIRLDVVGAVPPELELRSLAMTDAQYARFLTALRATFGDERPLATPGFTDTDLFYPAKGRFNGFRTCNVWVGEMIRAAGLRFGLWTPLPLSVSLSHWLYQSTGRTAN
ncbi:TIGR02117 family protein [Pseudosulfitobacter pseudonitzschiae]|uniref:TIGR02117 family protein n=1 Tax=Pseudosulfitobacter pseudonitzschiae TaxID=1402135 RepID=UPI00399A2039